jgi:hypothetical protein
VDDEHGLAVPHLEQHLARRVDLDVRTAEAFTSRRQSCSPTRPTRARPCTFWKASTAS